MYQLPPPSPYRFVPNDARRVPFNPGSGALPPGVRVPGAVEEAQQSILEPGPAIGRQFWRDYRRDAGGITLVAALACAIGAGLLYRRSRRVRSR